MPRFAANIDWLFTEVPFLQRFAHAAQAGFGAVECMFPYAWPAQELAAQARAAGRLQTLCLQHRSHVVLLAAPPSALGVVGHSPH